MIGFDRVKAGLANFVRGCFPRIDYLARYEGTVIAQSGPNSFDFQPDSRKVPGGSKIPVRLGLPGVTVLLNLGAKPRCLLGFDGGDPTKPFLDLWDAPGLQALTVAAQASISLQAPSVGLGQAPTDFLLLGTSYLSALSVFDTAFSTWQTAFAAYIAAIQSVADPSGSATAAMSTATAALHTELGLFDAAAQAAISSVSQTQ